MQPAATQPHVMSWNEKDHQLGIIMPVRHQLHTTPEQEDHPSESRPYKQYCTTLLTLVKAEAILIGSRLQGDECDTDFFTAWENLNLRPTGDPKETGGRR